MSGIFDLDEDREDLSPKKTSPSRRTSPTVETAPFVPTTSPGRPAVQIPPPPPTSQGLLQPQPYTGGAPHHRKNAASFAATPSFPSPLAQATVPYHSDNSSSSSHSSPHNSDGEDEGKQRNHDSPRSQSSGTPRRLPDAIPRARTASPNTTRSASPASTQKSSSRPPSPSSSKATIPATILMRKRRSGSSGALSASMAMPAPAEGSARKQDFTFPAQQRARADSSNQDRPRTASQSSSLGVPYSASSVSGSSPLAFGSPELEPVPDSSSRRGSMTGMSEGAKDLLGLGLSTNWDSISGSSSSFGSGLGPNRDKGKGKDIMTPPSPRREKDKPLSSAAVPIGSPPRQRRPSEFLNPSSLDVRKMPSMGSRGLMAGPVATLSTSASMISPLNPLPSPWSSSSDDNGGLSASLSSDISRTGGSSTQGASAIRLTRVPTSVRMAADLIKNPSAAPPLSSTPVSVGSATSAGTSEPSPTTSSSAPPFGSMSPPPVPPPAPHAALPAPSARLGHIDLGKGRPNLAVSSQPMLAPSRDISPLQFRVPESPASEKRSVSDGTVAPPSAFKTPALPASVRNRPSAPPAVETKADTFSGSARHHRYRTSMHEATFKPSMWSADITDSPPSWSTSSGSGSAPVSSQDATFGLGLQLPSTSAALASGASGSRTPGILGERPRLRSVTGQALQMDLAGVGSLGDAASHASMIMQSRQAKLQRWRPNSSGNVTGEASRLPPAFNRSTTTGAPAMLAGPRMDRQAQWGLRDSPPHPTHSLSVGTTALVPSTSLQMMNLTPMTGTLPLPSNSDTTTAPLNSNAGPSRFTAAAAGGLGMERAGSATGMVGGIEWVDWLDCYKRYKEEKIRAEAEAAAAKARDSSTDRLSPLARSASRHSPQEIDLSSSIENSSALALSPTTSRDEVGSMDPRLRKRSLSIRSTLSNLDLSRSPSQKRMSFLDRPRQASGGSVRSTDSASGAAVKKKKKNLVNKMEGWWNSVKSNFTPESTVPRGPIGVPRARIPSAPTSRRGSDKEYSLPGSRRGSDKDKNVIAAPAAALLAPQPILKDSFQSLRRKLSNLDLGRSEAAYDAQSLQDAADIVDPERATIKRLPSLSPSVRTELSDIASSRAAPSPGAVPRQSSSLDTRRKQPGLRLELESSVLTRGTVVRTETGGSSQSPASQRPSDFSSRSTSYALSLGPGLTPGTIPRWDQTPSPLMMLGDKQGDPKESQPVAPGADLTVASVRRHVKHRLNAAKDACDNTLKKTIDAMTRFADEQRRIADEEQLRLAESVEPRDYFEGANESPLLDVDDSESEGGDRFDRAGGGSRAVSSSRGPSRRPSISRPGGVPTSPTARRMSILPSSPSRVRRRPSAPAKQFAGRERQIARNLSLSLEKTKSNSSSRSTSRSRSPMPPMRGLLPGLASLENQQILALLQELIVIATDVLDLSVNTLISKPSACREIIPKLQAIGHQWEDHVDWPGRDWYVEILFAVAGLNRVLDWWEAEKGFWNFDDEGDHEPLVFVLKPTKEESKFDQEFKAAVPAQMSPAVSTLQMAEPPTAVSLELPSPDGLSGSGSGTFTGRTAIGAVAGTPRARAIDDLRYLAEHAKMVNIVMELSLQGEEIIYVSDAISEVTGQDPEEVMDKSITDLVAPADAGIFGEASRKLQEDDNNTVQLRVRFEAHRRAAEEGEIRQIGPIYIELEGVGMLMRENNEPSHTMWVLKPVTATAGDQIVDASFPQGAMLSNENVLCRICEREIVIWFFEKHNETCDAVHRLDAEISNCNECLHDLAQTVTALKDDLRKSETSQYQGVVFFTLPESVVTGDDGQLSSPQGVELRKLADANLEDVIEMLKTAELIDTPSVQEDEADLSFNVQRYLPPDDEDKLIAVARWQKPQTTDRALTLLLTQVEEQMRRKQKAVARMQSTIRYSEKTRHEWEDKVNQLLGGLQESETSESGSDGGDADPASSPVDKTPSSNSAPEISPPTYRKIAPKARLPITQGHPQRPATSHAESTVPSATVPSTPAPLAIGARTPMPLSSLTGFVPPASAPPITATAPTTTLLQPPEKVTTKSTSPLQIPADHMRHARRVSMSVGMGAAPLSPRIPPAALPTRLPPQSIKDFEVIKPISRGAFGHVYLAKKKTTGDYYAVKALKKSDMIAKNQITNVKAERTILMNQASSPYVAKLFFSFQSKDYLYLVMEYLNGGDCATLIKQLGGIPEEWARNYIAEVTLGLEYLHARNIVHRDIKPDNLLIDAKGHLKLTDFGLSKIGLLNRQVGGPRPPFRRGSSLRGSRPNRQPFMRSTSGSSNDSPGMSPELLPVVPSSLSQSYFAGVTELGSADESSESDSAGIVAEHLRQVNLSTHDTSRSGTSSVAPRDSPRFVGTPDYLAPESILGIGTDDRVVDWWALGVVLYEFIYGFPPFHADTPEKVFDNVVSRRIDWHDDEMDISPPCRDLMDRLMCSDPSRRLGARGAEEVKRHAFFAGIDWDTVTTTEAGFVPEINDPESTDYFDARGAVHGFHDDDSVPQILKPEPGGKIDRAATELTAVLNDMAKTDDFGTFNFKNYPVLKQANDDVIRKLRVDSLVPIGNALDLQPKKRTRSLSTRNRHGKVRQPADLINDGPPSPSESTSSTASTPSRASIPPSTPGTAAIMPQHFRRPSELNALDRVKSLDEGERLRRKSDPSRTRAGSGSSMSDRSAGQELWRQKRQASLQTEITPPPAATLVPPMDSPEAQPTQASSDRTLDILIAEDNPISQKILETLLTRMGCRCICVEDGPAALAACMGHIRFDVIICDIHMPVVSGEQVARMIRSTNNHNQDTPIIAATSYEQHQSITEEGTVFSAVLAKPVSKADLFKCFAKLGFELSTRDKDKPSETSSAPLSAHPSAQLA